MAQLLLHCLEKTGAGARRPLAGLSRCRPCWNVPRGREPTEVIQANHVHVRQEGTQAVDTPSIPSRTKSVPVVDGVTPQLSLRTEIVRRNSSDEARPTLFVQQE